MDTISNLGEYRHAVSTLSPRPGPWRASSIGLAVIPLLLVALAGCKTKRLWDVCNAQNACAVGFTCTTDNRCVPDDGGVPSDGGGGSGAGSGGAAGGSGGSVGGSGGGGTDGSSGDADGPMVGCGGDGDCKDPTAPACDLGARRCVACVGNVHCTIAGKLVCDTAAHQCVRCLAGSDCAAPSSACEPGTHTCVACVSSTDCKPPSSSCETSSHTCVACLTSTDCKAPAGVCETSSHTCVTCLANGDCGGMTPVCDTAARTCVGCLKSTDCSGGKAVCDTGAKSCVQCLTSTDCGGATPVCNTPARTCVGCLKSTDCSGTKAVCDTSATTCVQCLTNADCGGATPVCDAKVCRACKADAECVTKLGTDPGVCMDDGHCPTSDEVLYVKGGATDCPGAGTVAMPYCQAQTAMNAINTAKKIVVLRGLVADWTLSFSTAPVTVIGQSSAAVRAGGANDGVTISGADVLIRDLSVSAGGGAGVVAKSGSTLRLHRCLIEGNTGGAGIQTTNAAFDIENTAVAKNGGANFSGVNLGATTATPQIFRNNTVVENGFGGIVCGASYAIVGTISHGNGVAQFSPMCNTVDACATSCSTMDPMLDETAGKYQLTASSPAACKDVLTSAPPTDRKGTLRPQGPKSDCGSDEWTPP